MATLVEKRNAAFEKARTILEKAKAGEDLTDEQISEKDSAVAEVKEFDRKLAEAKDADELLNALGVTEHEKRSARETVAKSLGEHAVMGLKDSFGNIKGRRRTQADLPEYTGVKDPGDVQVTGNSVGAEGLQRSQLDTNIVKGYIERPVVADWLGAGTMTATALTYFIEKDWDVDENGRFKAVAENAKKPGMTAPDYEQKTENLKKLAGWIKLSDEMAEDFDFIVSEINNRLLFQLVLEEEEQLLNGDGKSGNVLGLLNREGLQEITSTDREADIDTVFMANTRIFQNTGLRADGILINPADYQRLRLLKDANGQYLAGGPFAGQYGVGGIMQDPPLWGLRTIQTTAVPEGQAVIGAGKLAATVYRKGGVRVEASNVDGEDFTHNRFTILAEERLTLAVRRPNAFCIINFGQQAGGGDASGEG